MPVDPHIQVLLDAMADMDVPAISEQTPQEVRAAFGEFAAADKGDPAVGEVEDRSIPGPDGDIAVRVYRPEGDGPHPAVVWFHGGGWVIGDLDTADGTCRRLCVGSGAAVVSVDYRLAPEHPAPAAFRDCWAATEWVAAHGPDIGVDPTRLGVGGDSAGGNLAALVAVRARDVGAPPLRMQLLVYPATDLTMSHPSITSNGEGFFLTREAMRWFTDNYLGPDQRHGDPTDASVSPLCVRNLRGVAPATVVTAEFDPLRDEGDAYASRLAEAGVAVEHDTNPGMIHGFFSMATMVPAAEVCIGRASVHLRRALA